MPVNDSETTIPPTGFQWANADTRPEEYFLSINGYISFMFFDGRESQIHSSLEFTHSHVNGSV
jgi:hypothetical protein